MLSETGVRQRLAAILAADAVGYSRLIAIDDRAALSALDEARGVFRRHIDSNHGRVIDMAGDSILAMFDLASAAVAAALQVQKQLSSLPAVLSESRAMRFRIGLHIGEVLEKDDGTIYGDGVNVAARLQALAQPGDIAASELIRGAVKNKVRAKFEDRGEQTVKNIAEPIRWYRVVPADDAPVGKIDLTLPDKPSIAVLPFANMSSDPEQEHFTDGITEDVITELSRFRSLFVIARNSTFTYKNKNTDVRKVASELGVRYVVEGSIRRSGNRIRLTAQLIDAISGGHVWAERYDRELEDVFAVQEELTRSIVARIAPEIDAAELAKTQRRPGSLNAYETAVRAWAYTQRAYYQQDHALRKQAMKEARHALSLDATSVLALNALAGSLWQEVFFRTSPDMDADREAGLEIATRMIELERSHHLAYMWRGLLRFSTLKHWDEALADLRLAHEINPNDTLALNALTFVEDLAGEPDAAIDHLLQMLRLSPKDPWAANTHALLAAAYFVKCDYATGAAWALLAIQGEPKFLMGYVNAAQCYVGLQRIEEAAKMVQEARRIAPTWIDARLNGYSLYRRAEDRARQTTFLRVASGLEERSVVDTLR
jgi:adenylate cyclase